MKKLFFILLIGLTFIKFVSAEAPSIKSNLTSKEGNTIQIDTEHDKLKVTENSTQEKVTITNNLSIALHSLSIQLDNKGEDLLNSDKNVCENIVLNPGTNCSFSIIISLQQAHSLTGDVSIGVNALGMDNTNYSGTKNIKYINTISMPYSSDDSQGFFDYGTSFTVINQTNQEIYYYYNNRLSPEDYESINTIKATSSSDYVWAWDNKDPTQTLTFIIPTKDTDPTHAFLIISTQELQMGHFAYQKDSELNFYSTFSAGPFEIRPYGIIPLDARYDTQVWVNRYLSSIKFGVAGDGHIQFNKGTIIFTEDKPGIVEMNFKDIEPPKPNPYDPSDM